MERKHKGVYIYIYIYDIQRGGWLTCRWGIDVEFYRWLLENGGVEERLFLDDSLILSGNLRASSLPHRICFDGNGSHCR